MSDKNEQADDEQVTRENHSTVVSDRLKNESAKHQLDDTMSSNNDGQPDSKKALTAAPPQNEPKPAVGSNFNKYFLYTLVGGLVISALISVVAVLTGEFSSMMAKALGTTGSMVIHTLIALFLVSLSNQNKSKGSGFVLNILLLITIASFITTLLQIWEVISGRTAFDLYVAYVYGFFVSLWVQLLMKLGENLVDKTTRISSYAAIGLSVLFYVLLLPTIFTHGPERLPELHYRALAATVILLATASVLTIVFRRIYVFKHPEVKSLPSSNTAWDVIIACVVLFIGVPFIIGVLSSLSSYKSSQYGYDIENRKVSSSSQPNKSSRPTTSTTPYRSSVSAHHSVEDCSKRPEFQDPNVLLYYSTYTFLSHDESRKQLSAAWAYNGEKMQPIEYDGTLTAVDSKCVKIPVNTLKEGDTIVLYLRTGYSNFYSDALEFVQKAD